MKDSNLKVLDFKTPKEPIKVLGVHLSYNKNKCNEKKIYAKLDQQSENKIKLMALKRSHNIWQAFSRKLNKHITVMILS